MRGKRVFTLLFLLTFLVGTLLSLIPTPKAEAAGYISDPKDINPPEGARVEVANFETTNYSSGFWKIYVDGKQAGEDLCLHVLKNNDEYNYVAWSVVDDWIDVLTPEPVATGYYKDATFSKDINSIKSGLTLYTLKYVDTGQTSKRVHVRNLGAYAGTEDVTYDGKSKKVYFNTTPFPTGAISYPDGIKEGDRVTFQIRGTSYVPEIGELQSKPKISYIFYVDGVVQKNNSLFKNTFEDSYNTTLSVGTHSLTLKIKDAISRTTTYTKSITVAAKAQPPTPPPSGGLNARLDMELDPSIITEGDTKPVSISLDASDSTSSGDGPFAYRWWVKKNGSYITPSDGVTTGSTPSYAIDASNCRAGDKIWAQVKFYDYSLNQYDYDEVEKVIGSEEATPEPPPDPPEPPPDPEPPVAQFTMPSTIGVGETVRVKNTSYDPDGPEIYGVTMDVDWEVSTDDYSGILQPAGGNIRFSLPGTYTVYLTVRDTDGLSDSTSRDIEVINQPPKADITAPDEVMQGDDVDIESTSYDPDGEITSYTWSVTPAGMVGNLQGEGSTVYFDIPGQYTVSLTVKDRFGESDTATKVITVKPAVPTAFFDYTGIAKQNRKMTFDSSYSLSSKRYPIDWSKNEWQFIPPAGVSQDDVKIVSSSDLKTRTVLFKKPGDYKVKLRVTNTAGNTSEWYEQTVTIYPDRPPIADFYLYKTTLRDPDDSDYATIQLFDQSYSPDGDTISQRIWKYRYDSDNDGDFNDESWATLDSGNNTNPVLKVKSVGKYQFELYVKEAFGQETIPEFIVPSDYMTDNTDDKAITDKISEVINTRPVVNFENMIIPKIDLNLHIVSDNNTLINNFNQGKASFAADLRSAGNKVYVQEVVDQSHQSLSTILKDHIYFGASRRPYNPDYIQTYNYDYYSHLGEFDLPMIYSNGTADNDFNSLRIYVGYINFVSEDDYTPDEYPKVYISIDGLKWTLLPLSYTGNYSDWYITGTSKFASREFVFITPYITQNVRYIKVTDSSGSTMIDTVVYVSAYAYGNTQTITPPVLDDSKFVNDLSRSWADTENRYEIMISNLTSNITDANEIVAKYLAQNIKVIFVGTSNLQSVGQKIATDTGGAFIQFDGVNIPWSQIEDYINGKVAPQKVITNTVLLGDEVRYNTFYSDIESDPKYQERWVYTHDPNYFENSLGMATYNGQYIPAPITVFDKVGKFDVTFEARDNPKNDDRFDNYRMWSYMPLSKLTLYVHRRPLALFNSQVAGTKTYKNYYANSTIIVDTNNEEVRQVKFTVPRAYYVDPLKQRHSIDYIGGYVEGYRNGAWDTIKSYSGTMQTKSDTISLSGIAYEKIRIRFILGSSANSYDPGSYEIVTVGYPYDEDSQYFIVQLTSQSYDLDHQSEAGHGIVQEEWKWKEADATTWNMGKPTTLAANKTYMISLRVKDPEGVWSYPNVKLVSTIPVNMPPIAQFTVSPNPLPIGKAAVYDDMSYDPNGDPIVERKWRMAKLPSGDWVDYGSTPPNNFASLGVGQYKIELAVKDSKGAWSVPYYQTLEVIEDNHKPVARFTVMPNPLPIDVLAAYTDTSYDPDGDPIVAREWRYQKGTGPWVSGQPIDFSGLGTGTYNIQLRVKDQPALSQMTSLWSDWYQQTLSVVAGNQKPIARFTVTPNPAMVDEPVTYTDTSYDPEGKPLSERVWQVRDTSGRVLGEYHDHIPPTIFEGTGWGDNGVGTYVIALKVKDTSPNGISPALWSDWYTQTLVVEDPLSVIGHSDKGTYHAAEAMILSADTEGRAFKVEAQMWWDGGNDFVDTNVTTLVPDGPVGGSPPKENHWVTRHDVLGGDYDRVVIIPKDMPDGTYQVKFTAYKKRQDGSIKTATHTITVKVQGHQYNRVKSRLIHYDDLTGK